MQPGQVLHANGGLCVPSLAGQGPVIMPGEFSYQLWAIERLSGQRVALPIVHLSDLHRRSFFLMGIPADQNLRHTLRLYDFDAHSSTLVTVRVWSTDIFPDERVLAETSVTLTPPPRVYPNIYALPGYAQLGSLRDLFPEITRWPPMVHVELISEDPDRRLWAMMTITSNINGQVTIVTPDQER
jgi:hypothetical protein